MDARTDVTIMALERSSLVLDVTNVRSIERLQEENPRVVAVAYNDANLSYKKNTFFGGMYVYWRALFSLSKYV